MKKVCILFLIVGGLFASPINNMPDDVLIPTYMPMEPARELHTPRVNEGTKAELGDELDRAWLKEEVYPMEYVAFRVDPMGERVDAVHQDYDLSETAWIAAEMVPEWLRPAYITNMRELSISGLDEPYSQVVIDAPEELRDEVAFQYAHISRRGLNNSRYTRDYMLPLRNAELIYAYADSLPYVRILEHDDYTTLEYRVVEEGDTIWAEIDRDIYYWYVVHPKLSDEGIYSSDDEGSSNQRTYDFFYREYLWHNPNPDYNYQLLADSVHYPLLSDRMKECTVLWDRTAESWPGTERPREAAGAAGIWVSNMMPGTPEGARPVQPNQLAMWHRGNCGEGQDILGGAMRTALIPCMLVCNIAEDHVWNEFWDGEWWFVQVDNHGGSTALNAGWRGYDRDHGGGKDISSVWGYRGDGYLFQVTERYSNICTLTISVEDIDGDPVDGAYILVANESFYDPSALTYCTLLWTDSHGKAILPCGDAQNYYIRVMTDFGNYPPGDEMNVNLAAEETETGMLYSANVTINGAPYTFFEPNPVDADSGEYYVHLSVDTEDIIVGENEALDSQNSQFRYNTGYDGRVRVFVVDSTNLSRYERGLSFDAYEYTEPITGGNLELSMPTPDGVWYVVVANSECFVNHQLVEARARLIRGSRESVKEDIITNMPQLTTANGEIHISGNAGTISGSLKIFDISGRCVATLKEGIIPTGSYSTGALANGIYLATLTTEKGRVTKRLAVVR